jgi:hypothetical protein
MARQPSSIVKTISGKWTAKSQMDLSVTLAKAMPDYFIYGMAPSSGTLSPLKRTIVLDAIGLGMNIVNGLLPLAGITVLEASGDHLIVDTGTRQLPIGAAEFLESFARGETFDNHNKNRRKIG